MSGSLFALRPVQERALDLLRASIKGGHRRPQLELPTGAGKTVIAAHIVHNALERGHRPAFVVPLLSLIDQTVERFTQNGIPLDKIGVTQADHPMRRPQAPVQVCSVQTISRRGFPNSDLVIIDESHLQYGAVYRWMEEDPKRIFVGLSATPWAVGMGKHWDDLVKPTTLRDLIAAGDCCPFRAFAPSKPDLAGVEVKAGDYVVDQLSDRMSEKSIVADVVLTWLQRAEGRPTMVFCVDRAHAARLHDEFCSVGVASAYVDAFTDSEERDSVKRLFHRGDIKVVCSVGTLIAGVDWDVRCISFCRPTKSPIIYVQAIGRGLRTAPGKDDLLILDHSNATLELGLPTDIKFDRLRQGKKGASSSPKTERLPSPRECPRCEQIVAATERECVCGHVFRVQSKVQVVDGELSEVGSDKKSLRRENRLTEKSQKAHFFGELKYFAAMKNYNSGWCAHKYRARFGVWPDDPEINEAAEMPPSHETLGWIRSQQIRYAKRPIHSVHLCESQN